MAEKSSRAPATLTTVMRATTEESVGKSLGLVCGHSAGWNTKRPADKTYPLNCA
jgi:hypothetical protein